MLLLLSKPPTSSWTPPPKTSGTAFIVWSVSTAPPRYARKISPIGSIARTAVSMAARTIATRAPASGDVISAGAAYISLAVCT